MKRNFKPRSIIVFLLFSLLYIIIAINLYTIQIKKHHFYSQLAQQQYHVTITQRPPRGTIIDRTGENFLAMNYNYISAFVLPHQIKYPRETMAFLHEHFPEGYNRMKNNSAKRFLFIKRKLSAQEQELIITTKKHDICLLSEPGRYYPISSTGPLIGATNNDNKGLFGLELLYDHILAGEPTTYQLEKDARSGYYYFEKRKTVTGNLGKNIQLTVDADLQFLTQEAVRATVEKFNAQSGAAIIINPKNGEIISMTCYPCCDSNDTRTMTVDLCKNSIITDAHELGSVMKVCSALAALEENVVTQDELIDCQDTKSTLIDGRKINTVKAHGIIPFSDVIAFSNNIGIAIVAKRLDTKLYDHYKRLGFGTKTGIAFPGENPGFITPPNKWSKQSIISLSYGYEVSATILQLACAFCIIATGYKIVPTLVVSQKESTPQEPLYSKENITIIHDILERTTLYGTARRAAMKGYKVMSKTGTANMLIDGQYVSDKNLYCCAGIIEKENYQRVIVTFIKQAQQKNLYASKVAVPLFEEIAERMLIHDRIIS